MEAKRSLGQNFFINKNLGDRIIQEVQNSTDIAVEIGPGQGFFTERLIEKFKEVILIEKDTEIAKILRETYPNLTIYNEDFLDFDLTKLPKDITFFGSLPYNVSKPIIRKIIESDRFNNPAYFIIQKEVAQKYIYKDPYNILSLNTNIYSDVKKILDISPEAFRPRPRVNSSFTRFTPNRKDIEGIKTLSNLITLSFKQPRKNLKNNLKGSPYRDLIKDFESRRPSELSLEQYQEILQN
jgi:16S rRNA (adenine1518-N6/adenine1519-N6)-dimethyltransferase